MSALPEAILEAVGAIREQRVTLVVGAGTSREAPTSLLLAGELSQAAHDALVDEGVLDPGECADPRDLATLADLVVNKTTRQEPLVRRMRWKDLRDAKPNMAHLTAVALMLEGVIRSIVTLNFDSALTHALADRNAGGRIGVIRGPEEWERSGANSIVFLHRSIEGDWEKLVLRTQSIDVEWQAGWEQIVAMATVASPICIFAGIGASTPVFVATSRAVRDALPAEPYVAGPGEYARSRFAAELGVPEGRYIRLGWLQLMQELERRFLARLSRDIASACQELADANGFAIEDINGVRDRCLSGGLVAFGTERAAWLEQRDRYLESETGQLPMLADVLLGIALVERKNDALHRSVGDGVVEFYRDRFLVGRAVVAHGSGAISQDALEARVHRRLAAAGPAAGPSVLLANGANRRGTVATPPESVVAPAEPANLIDPSLPIRTMFFEDLRENDELAVTMWT